MRQDTQVTLNKLAEKIENIETVLLIRRCGGYMLLIIKLIVTSRRRNFILLYINIV